MEVDLRIRKSKHHLRKSLITLLHSNTFEKINISMICKEANVSRVTFYNYYMSKIELAEDIVNLVVSSIIKRTKQELHSNEFTVEYSKLLMNNLIEESYNYKMIVPKLNASGNVSLYRVVDKLFEKRLREVIAFNLSECDIHLSSHVLTSLIVGGMSKVVIDWIRRPGELGKEELKVNFANIIDKFTAFYKQECINCQKTDLCNKFMDEKAEAK